MRILQVIDSLDPRYGGPAELVSQTNAELRGRGDAVEVVAFRDVEGGLGPARGRYGYSRRGARWLAANVHRFDAVVIHGIWQHSALAAARNAYASGVPYFIYPHGALDHALPGLFPLRHLKKVAYWELCGRSILERAAGVCFTSANERSRATGFRGKFRSLTIGGGVQRPPPSSEGSIESLRARFPMLRDSTVLLFMGRLDPIKGLELLIRCVAEVRHPRVSLIIAGEGSPSYKRRLQRLAASVGCAESIAWAGLLRGEDKWAAFHLADLFVLTSQQDSFAVAAVEALATGTPVLLTNRVGISDTVATYDAGIVCEYDRDGIAAGLRRWLSGRDGHEAAARGNAVLCYEENFTAAAAAACLRSAIAAGAAVVECGIATVGPN